MLKRAVALIAGTLVVGLLIAGCGGGDDDGATTGTAGTETASGTDAGSGSADTESSDGDTAEEDGETKTIAKAEFIKRGDQICEVTVKKVTTEAFPILEKASGKSDSFKKDAETELVGTVLLPALEAEMEGLRALGTPPGDEAQISAILDEIQEIIEEGEANPEAFGPGAARPYTEAERLAEKYGLSECPYG